MSKYFEERDLYQDFNILLNDGNYNDEDIDIVLNALIEQNNTSKVYHCCVSANDNKMIEYLIEKDFDINTLTNDTGETPLHRAIEHQNAEMIEILVNKKADIEKCDLVGDTPLLCASYLGYVDMVKSLIINKADINNSSKEENRSALFIATENRHPDVVKLLIENKADITIRTDNDITAIDFAFENKYDDVVDAIVKANNFDINMLYNDEETLLHKATLENCPGIVKVLLDNKADININDYNGFKPIFWAKENNYKDIVNLLQKHK
eukprot:TRINITY_DN13189_c0_g1_i1.p1 TRINITY_DN13189_c0_g1~~TRINITY_DN13189_c0_g1_i1.p1  ORF type:complete len:266 (+),score=80.78 TRINITY_DN13189_c0_g1_i1:113-910(+)